nr:cyclic peptide export ABC transporter [uncultured Chitinophaga sp.]
MRRILKIILPQIGKLGLVKYVLLGILSGAFSFLFVNSVTRVIGQIISGGFTSISAEYILTFAGIILAYIWIRRTLALAIIDLAQTFFWKLRLRILSIVLNANYQQLSSRRSKIYTALFHDVYVLTDASTSVIGFATSLILALASLAYLASISLILFAITLVIASLGITVYHFGSKRSNKRFEITRALENKFVKNADGILDGFKEIFIEPRKGKAIFENKILPIASDSYNNNTVAFTGFLNNQITGQVLFYVLISSILLFFGIVLKIKPNEIVSFVFTLLYLLGSIETIMVILPGLMRARVASNHLVALTSELQEANFHNPLPDTYITKKDFGHIVVSDLEFNYGENEEAFGVGPVNFEAGKGEIVFIYGGNGSGKTTFIYSLLGLCVPTAGEIRLNDILVDQHTYPAYRAVFSVVFSNFYLFDELLGLENFNQEKWNYYLDLFELKGKVTLDGANFSTTDLSTGQRKRLALIAALMEEKPVLVIDEWAADQDPYFRRKFYLEILPMLKEDGLTIIAITHDDKYYHCADKLYRMEYGKLQRDFVHAPAMLK